MVSYFQFRYLNRGHVSFPLLLISVLLIIFSLISFVHSLNVHIIAHTHDDVGWIKTIDQYYTGTNKAWGNSAVRYILDSVIQALAANPERKFIYVEQAFFQRWWREQKDDIKNLTRNLVQNGQLEFINGGYCMHDEAASHYIDMVDQTTRGHSFLLNEFGAIPVTGWQIDPFGHSATQAALMTAETGFLGLFFARIDHADNDHRQKDKSLEFIWQASPSLPDAKVFAGAFASETYGPPQGVCFGQTCWLDTANYIQDDPNLEEYNVPERVETAVKVANELAAVHRGEDVMFTLGNDFNYQNADIWFKNIDKLIKHVNADGRINMFYSNPSQYIRAKLATKNVTWPVKTDDLMPYSDSPHAYWTGYYTSRSALKRYIRESSAFLQAARQIDFFGGGNGGQTDMLWDAVSVAQHHDGITGTEVQWVADDYAYRLYIGGVEAQEMVAANLAKFVSANGGYAPTFTHCLLMNISICAPTQSGTNHTIVLYNARSEVTRAERLVELPVNDPSDCTIADKSGTIISSQVVQTMKTRASLPRSSPYMCSFHASVPALGYTTYFLLTNVSSSVHQPSIETITDTQVTSSISNTYWKLDFDTNTGLLFKATYLPENVALSLSQEYLYYPSSNSSSAYVFTPRQQTPLPTSDSVPTLTLINGTTYSEMRQVFSDFASGYVRLISNSPIIEFGYTIGPIPVVLDYQPKEVITRFNLTELNNGGVFYTDSNGREFQKRTRNQRPTWNWTIDEPVSGNYYPITTTIKMKDQKSNMTLSIITDRSQGASSITDGSIEININRRLLCGLLCLNETDPVDGDGIRVTGRHYLVFNSPNRPNADTSIRSVQNSVYHPFITQFAPLQGSVSDYISNHVVEQSFINTSLPPAIELMTLSARNGSTLLRLSHTYGINEDSEYATAVDVDISTLFSKTIINITELSLTANQLAKDMRNKRVEWKTEDISLNDKPYDYKWKESVGVTVSIAPMEIRTFSIVFANQEEKINTTE